MPLTSITSFIGIVLVVVFFITSSDSGSLVIDSITSGGKVDAPVSQRIFWVLIEGHWRSRSFSAAAWWRCRQWPFRPGCPLPSSCLSGAMPSSEA